MILYKIDRGGAVTSFDVQIHDRTQWKLFLRTILSLAIGDNEVIGYDTSIDSAPVPKGSARFMRLQYYPLHTNLNKVGDATNLTVNYEILSTIFIGDGMVGRGTCIFRVQDTVTKELFIIKDTWHDPKRSFTEGQILQLIDGIPYVPKYIQEVVVSTYSRSRTFLSRKITIDPHQGGTERLVQALSDKKFEDRIHLRLQMQASNTRLITEFKNRKELATALLCCVKGEVVIHSLPTLTDLFVMTAHKQAYEERGVLHRDIHLGNLFIDETDVGDNLVNVGKGKAKVEDSESTGMLGDWGISDCTRIPNPCNVKKPTELPHLPITRQFNRSEYSDSEDENFMNGPPPQPASQTDPPVQPSRPRTRRKKVPGKPKSPTPTDSQMSDATTINIKQVDLDDVYKASNPWFSENAPKNLLNRTVSRRPFAHSTEY
jgi:hypothetical protein